MLVPCLPSSSILAWPPARLGSAGRMRAGRGETARTSRTRRNKEGTRGAEQLISTANLKRGLVTPPHLSLGFFLGMNQITEEEGERSGKDVEEDRLMDQVDRGMGCSLPNWLRC